MTTISCPVHRNTRMLETAIQAGRFRVPRDRRIAEEILELLEDITWGRAGDDHMASLDTRVTALSGSKDPQTAGLGIDLSVELENHHEAFVSHIDTHNCPTSECLWLTPAPCQMTCPAGIDVPAYVSLIGEGKDAEAIAVIRKDNPLPWVCGLVCTRPCEFMCVRRRMDKPVAIKALKAFAAERALSMGEYVNPPQAPPNGHKVCVIGAGPGGLSAAFYLALKGYQVHVIEALPMAGGMLMVGIPRYRLPREVIDREVALIQDLGVTFQFNTRLGRDVTIEGLQAKGFEAFFVAIGAHRAFRLRVEGEDDYPQVLDAITFLKDVALGDRRPPGKQVIVIGGGNVAIDAARTCLRLGCASVTIAYRRTRKEMPADHEEVEQAEEEGVHFAFLTIPTAILGESGRVTALKALRAEMVAREGSDRLSPRPVGGSDFEMAADVIIPAIGQQVDHTCLAGFKKLGWTRRNTIHVNSVTMETDIPGVFAAGDAVTGPATVIEAIGGGKRAAEAIDRYLRGIPQPTLPLVPVRRRREPFTQLPASTKMSLQRPEMPLLSIDRRRTTFQGAELGYTENMVREEARRCLRCDVCRRCGWCVTICRDQMGVQALEMGYLDFDEPKPTDLRLTQERCIACGACAANCPNDAMQMYDLEEERILALCGTILNRQPLVRCKSCGETLGPARYLDFVQQRVGDISAVIHKNHLCQTCARSISVDRSNRDLVIDEY